MNAAEQLIEKIHQSGDDPVSFDFEERQLIYQWQRFAADMEVLTKVSTVRFMVSRTEEIICSCASWNDTFEIRGVGDSIYSAARAAVEALRGRM